jgi:hypothetical protein
MCDYTLRWGPRPAVRRLWSYVYEAVVLPSHGLALGRWWNPVDGGARDSGPWIWWAAETVPEGAVGVQPQLDETCVPWRVEREALNAALRSVGPFPGASEDD